MSLRRTISGAYGLYAVTVLGVAVVLTLIILLFVPRLDLRRRVARFSARTVFVLAGMKVTMRGNPLPEGPCVVVANHASYLDGIVLFAALPPEFSFMIKREITSAPLFGPLLRRLGMQFVERVDIRRGAIDTRRLIRHARAGQRIAAFPEGTFRSEPGLGLFRDGAFRAAVAGGQDVVPATIRGSRSILPAHRRLPVPGKIEIVLHAPVRVAVGGNREEVARVRDLARDAILSALDEPELDFAIPVVVE